MISRNEFWAAQNELFEAASSIDNSVERSRVYASLIGMYEGLLLRAVDSLDESTKENMLKNIKIMQESI